MATKPMLSIEEYLHTSFEDGDCEYLDGKLVPKPMPPKNHSEVQIALTEAFYRLRQRKHPLFAYSELRVRTTETHYRVPDLSVYAGLRPEEQVPSIAPYVAVEILSPDDRMAYLLEKLREYRAWGVAHIWVIDPMNGALFEFGSDGLMSVRLLRMPEYGLEITPAEIFDVE